MKKLLLIFALFALPTLSAQNGDTINEAIDVDGSAVNVNMLDYDSATSSGLIPACGTTEDVFYRHTTTVGDNKMTFGMTSASIAVDSDVEYQMFAAQSGDLNQLQLLDCSSYEILLFAGGSFQYVVENIDDSNVYYLRVHKASDVGGSLSTLMNNTTVTMRSDFDNTLSAADNISKKEFKFVVDKEKIKLLNNTNYNQFSVYAINGKKVISETDNQVLNTIDISQLNKGLYVINLESKSGNKAYKFIKQ